MKVNKKVIRIYFDDSNFDLEASDFITLSNHNKVAADFNFLPVFNGTFRAQPTRGQISPGGAAEIKICYVPSGNKIEEQESCIIKVKDGPDIDLKLFGHCSEVKYEFNKTSIDFGEIPIFKQELKKLILKNLSIKSNIIFQVQQKNLPQFIQVIPSYGKVLPEEQFVLNVVFLSTATVDYNMEIEFLFRGSKPYKIKIKVLTIIPDIKILEGGFNLGSITTGNTEGVDFQIQNNSRISTTVFFKFIED